MSVPKYFKASDIPDTVEDNVVNWNPRIVTEGSELFCSDSCLKGKEAHNYIKEVVKAGKTAVFHHLLACGFQMRLGDLVYLACQHGHLDIVKIIMDKGEDPNRVTKYGWTALEIAAINGRTEIVNLLVRSYGANVNLMNINNHYTPLENAIEGGHLDTVRMMMEELGAKFRGVEVAQLQSAAAVVSSQGELINQGQDHGEIKLYLQKKDNLPKHMELRISYRMSLGPS